MLKASRDIAHRHSERCSRRDGRPVTRPHGRGQPRKACDRCAGSKVSCDKAIPCAACSKSGAQCSYTRLEVTSRVQTRATAADDPSPVPEEPTRGLSRDIISCDISAAQPYRDMVGSSGPSSRVPFLLSYTLSKPGDPKDFAKALGTLQESSDDIMDEGPDDDPISHQIFPMFAPFFTAETADYNLPQHGPCLQDLSSHFQQVGGSNDKVFQQASIELIKFVDNVGRTASSPSSQAVAILLTPDNLAHCVKIFFRKAYQHIPVIHQSSFEPGNAELPLLLAVFVVGAVWSYPRDTYFMVLDVIEMIEVCIFEHQTFRKLQDQGGFGAENRSPQFLASLQAATLLVSISFAFPDPNHRRRFRDQRFLHLIAIIRELQCECIKESPAQMAHSADTFDWTTYVHRESCNRYAHHRASESLSADCYKESSTTYTY